MLPAIGTMLLQSLRADETPGASLALVRDGRIVYTSGFGTRDARRRILADARTRYGIGSVTKTIVAALIFRLAEQRRLSLDDPLARWLPAFATARDVRVRNLLQQTSGIRDYNDAVFLTSVARYALPGHVDRNTILAALARWPLGFAPGTRFAYSNSNYLILGAIAEQATGRPLRELLREQILAPLDMDDTALVAPTESGDEAAGFTKSPVGPQPVAPWDPEIAFTAGGLRSTALDLARFDAALCAGRVVSRASFDAMISPVRLADGSLSEYGAGFHVYVSRGRRVAWHDGTILGYKAMHLLLPQTCDAVILLANADYYHAVPVTLRVAQAAFGLYGGSGREPFDPNLPVNSMLLAAGVGALPLLLSLVLRRRRRLALLAALCAYVSGSVWLPLALWIAGIAVVAVAWPSAGGSAWLQARRRP